MCAVWFWSLYEGRGSIGNVFCNFGTVSLTQHSPFFVSPDEINVHRRLYATDLRFVSGVGLGETVVFLLFPAAFFVKREKQIAASVSMLQKKRSSNNEWYCVGALTWVARSRGLDESAVVLMARSASTTLIYASVLERDENIVGTVAVLFGLHSYVVSLLIKCCCAQAV